MDKQVLASQAEQVNSKANNLENLSSFGKLLIKDFGNTNENSKLKVIQFLQISKNQQGVGEQAIFNYLIINKKFKIIIKFL